MKKTELEDMSNFGKFCDHHRLTEQDVINIMGVSYNYARMLIRGDKVLTAYWCRFFYIFWESQFTEATKKMMKNSPVDDYKELEWKSQQ